MLQGTIDEFPLIDVLGILQARNKTGRLDIERRSGRGLIYVRLGEPYYAESSLARSLIGQKLVDIGAISDMQLRKALDRQADSGERLGEILLTHGLISREHIAAAVISQIKDALSDLLAWETGDFRWEAGAEVEVEVPLFGALLDSADNGGSPLAPHVVPVAPEEQDAGTSGQQPQAQSVEQPSFRQTGATLHGSAVAATQLKAVPEVESPPAPQLEVVETPVEVETEEVTPEDEGRFEPVAEVQPEFDPEPVFDYEPSAEAPQEFDPEPAFDYEPSAEAPQEFDPEPELVEAPAAEVGPEPELVEAPVAEVEPEPGLSPAPSFEPISIASPIEIEDDAPSLPPDNDHHVEGWSNGTRVIKSRPAPQLDEAFERVVETSGVPTFDEGFEPSPEVDLETPDAPEHEHHDEAGEESDNALETEAGPGYEPIEAPVVRAPEAPSAFAGAFANPSPPPPPPATPAPVAEIVPSAVVPSPAEAPWTPQGPQAPAENGNGDIKLDRSSLVRELSDLLR